MLDMNFITKIEFRSYKFYLQENVRGCALVFEKVVHIKNALLDTIISLTEHSFTDCSVLYRISLELLKIGNNIMKLYFFELSFNLFKIP